MTAAAKIEPKPDRPTRCRASQPAILATLEALKEAGLDVERVCIRGGQVEIHCGHVEAVEDDQEDAGLEDW
ncbi:MAG: hypothetical protein KDJ90_06590 [Nitratireductor sp.]|nr:hypothetical protein [Nitratireductor sp.]